MFNFLRDYTLQIRIKVESVVEALSKWKVGHYLFEKEESSYLYRTKVFVYVF